MHQTEKKTRGKKDLSCPRKAEENKQQAYGEAKAHEHKKGQKKGEQHAVLKRKVTRKNSEHQCWESFLWITVSQITET